MGLQECAGSCPHSGPGRLWVVASTWPSWASEAVFSGTGRKLPSRNPPAHPGVASSSILDPSFHIVVHEHMRAAETKPLRKGLLVLG